jgi:hypothetical protein
MAAVPGDIVRHDNEDHIVVDVTGDGFAVLRRADDVELLAPVVVEAASLEIVGHLDGLNGWIEDSPGEWRQS